MSDTPSDSVLHSRFCDLVGCRLPVVQTGMGWVSGASLTAATSHAGGFGILAAVTMTGDEMTAAIRAVKDRTPAAFGVNLRADQPDLAERVATCVAEGVPLVSFAGAPTKDAIARLHDAGVLVMPTVGARRHAEKMLDWGVDAVIAQGGEGGGHTGTVPTSLLLPQVVDAVATPSRCWVPAASTTGGAWWPPGPGAPTASRWAPASCSRPRATCPTGSRPRYLAAGVTDTVVTTALDGAPQRVVRTRTRRPAGAGVASLTRLPRALRSALRLPPHDRHPARRPRPGGRRHASATRT